MINIGTIIADVFLQALKIDVDFAGNGLMTMVCFIFSRIYFTIQIAHVKPESISCIFLEIQFIRTHLPHFTVIFQNQPF